ncbi:hypothetical protein TNCV_2498861 [Trichonephila clavipes]|nr:hypothetical protein TNCV_2498861 [Trichonephila clavipes]
MTQRMHLNDFYVIELLAIWNESIHSRKYLWNLESSRVASPGFGNHYKMMVTAQVASELHQMRTGILQLQPKETEHNIRPISSVLFSHWYNS